MSKDEHRPVLDGKFEESPLQFVAIGELGEVVARLLPVDREGRPIGAPRNYTAPNAVVISKNSVAGLALLTQVGSALFAVLSIWRYRRAVAR